MLILEIALGIVLAVLILAFLPVILIGLLILLGLGVAFAILFIAYEKHPDSRPPPAPAGWNYATGPTKDKTPKGLDAELARLREEVIGKMKEARDSAQKLLATHEEEKNNLTIEYKRRREFYSQGLISRAELNQVERALAEAIVRIEEDKRWLKDSDIAITQATKRDELLRSSKSP
jgi:hypothetical protein